MGKDLVKRATLLKDVLTEVSYDIDRFEAALTRLAKALAGAEPEVVRVSSQFFDYYALAAKLNHYAEELAKLAKGCKALSDLIGIKLGEEKAKTLRQRLMLQLVMQALKEGHRTPDAVRQYLETKGVFVSELTARQYLKDLVEMGLVVKLKKGTYMTVEDYLKEGGEG